MAATRYASASCVSPSCGSARRWPPGRHEQEHGRADGHPDEVHRDRVLPAGKLRDHDRFGRAQRGEPEERERAPAEPVPAGLGEDHGGAGERDDGAGERATAQPLHAVRDREEQRQQRPDRQHDGRDARRDVLQCPVQAPVRGPDREEAVHRDEREVAAARQRQAQGREQQPEDDGREREAEAGPPERVELPVAEPDRDEVRAADRDCSGERREREAVGCGLGGSGEGLDGGRGHWTKQTAPPGRLPGIGRTPHPGLNPGGDAPSRTRRRPRATRRRACGTGSRRGGPTVFGETTRSSATWRFVLPRATEAEHLHLAVGEPCRPPSAARGRCGGPAAASTQATASAVKARPRPRGCGRPPPHPERVARCGRAAVMPPRRPRP